MEVVITKHTEAELWNHLDNLYQKYLEEALDIINEQSKWVDWIFVNDPYKNFVWRNRSPKRVKFDEWMDGAKEEHYNEIMMEHFKFKYDFKLCGRVFGWDQTDHEKFVEYDAMDFEMFNKYSYDLKNEEFDFYENKKYEQSKKDWELKDAIWIEDNKLQKEHDTKHHTIYFHMKQMEQVEDKDFYIKWYFKDGILKNTEDPNCKFCVKAQKDRAEEPERKRLQEEREQEEERKLEESNRKWQEEKERERREEIANRETYCCKECNYSTFSSESFDVHEESKEHKKIMELRRFFCEDCSVQCRNQTEYSIHIQTKKHKIACGEIEKQTEFRCDPCEYVTGLKQNFDKHCLTKGHAEKTK